MADARKVLGRYFEARDHLKSLAKRQYTKGECPLNSGVEEHRDLAQALWGSGQYEWECEFCGELFIE